MPPFVLGHLKQSEREERAVDLGRVCAVPLWKRSMDVALIVALMPLWAPIMLIIAVGIRLSSKGPILFRQERIGYQERPFTLLKFRTMHEKVSTSEHEQYCAKLVASSAPMTKLDSKGDDRLIPCGRLLRATGLDELPQLFNVFRGEMSLVGPRPCLRYEYDHYLPWHKQRFCGLPGLTGLWQVNGKNRTTFSEMIQMDIRYLREMSPSSDLGIMIKTAPALFSQVMQTRRANREKQRSQKPAL